MLTEGSAFGAYEVRRRLAVGGMGEVYLCRHRVLDRLDAVKVLRPHLAGNADFRRRFLREALSAARLRHPNVVTVYTADERDGLLYLAMEYVAGEDLARRLERLGPVEPARAAALVRIVADALDSAHRVQLVHRDIKPSNLIVTESGPGGESVTLVDFGVSRVLDADSEITRTGEIVGTIAYSAPEQLSQGAVSGAVDQYALACVAFECLTGEVPYPRESQLAIMTAHLTAPPPSVADRRPGLPAAIDAVLARGMAKDPAARYPTCTAFADALAAAVAERLDTQHPAFPGPEALRTRLSGRDLGLVRGTADADFGTLRVGWAGGNEAGSGGAPVVVDGALLIRGVPELTAGVTRWLIVQAAALHRARHLCLACGLSPVAGEGWMWVNWLPHARPGNPPLAGPHYATSVEAAADLFRRLRAVVGDRRSGAAAVAGAPRVLVLLDTALGGAGIDPAELSAPTLGVALILLAPPQAPPIPGMSTLDLREDGAFFTPAGGTGFALIPDTVSPTEARDLVDLLPED